MYASVWQPQSLDKIDGFRYYLFIGGGCAVYYCVSEMYKVFLVKAATDPAASRPAAVAGNSLAATKPGLGSRG